AAVEVDERRRRAVDPARLCDVHVLRRVLLEMCARDSDRDLAVRRRHGELPAGAQRLVVLADLVRLRVVGIEVLLAVEDGALRDLAVEREPQLDRLLHRPPVRHRQRTRECEAHRARLRVRLAAEAVAAAAEHLRLRLQLHVDLEADHGLPFLCSGAGKAGTCTDGRLRRAYAAAHVRYLAGTTLKSSASSSAWPTRKSVFSANCAPTSCRPTGRPSERPHGMLRPGRPAMHDGIVSRSFMYIASGSCTFAPSGNATVGLVGESSTSNRRNSSSCSRLITVRTFCAVP